MTVYGKHAMLDIKDAFNSRSLGRIQSALAHLGVPGYLTTLVESYLSKKTLANGMDESRYSRDTTRLGTGPLTMKRHI